MDPADLRQAEEVIKKLRTDLLCGDDAFSPKAMAFFIIALDKLSEARQYLELSALEQAESICSFSRKR
jgi:hypothetical protein